MADIKVLHCHPSPHIGETLTVNYLRHHLPSGAILANYHLPDGTGTLEIDVVVLNYNGVYLLEVKHWYGAIEADQLHWRHSSGDLRPNPIPIIEQKAKVLNGFLRDQGWPDVSVVGLVVLSKGTNALHTDDPQAHKVFGLHSSLIEALNGREYVFHPSSRILRSSEIHRLRNALLSSHVTDATRQVAGYRVVEQRDRGHYADLVAEDLEFPGRRVRIKQYDVPAIGSTHELEEAVLRFKREMTALMHAGSHPNLVMPHQFRRDMDSDERYYLILEWAGEETLAERLERGIIDPEEQLVILRDIASGMAHCHGHDVLHRNLSPSSVYLTQTGQAKIGDFDFARIGSISRTLARTGKPLVLGRHVSPEQAFHAHDIDARADIYSLGAIWYDMLIRPSREAPLDRERIAQASLSSEARDILEAMLAERRDERLSSMREVLGWLDLLTS